ncbi:MAG: PAS domain S-box protein, partial [Chroococcidiopsidaceae cyanobacterium CP_BM_RX_35]|nr:PAS domain S-box protein [Chroococcidiopsidaceae cyanobacterium CP_BM_RX_35]
MASAAILSARGGLMKNLNQSDKFPIAMRTSEQIRAEIEDKLGFFPPFFAPAQQNPSILENLWQQTVHADGNNPLPSLFKEKLAAYLSRYCNVPYSIVCHSCCLYSLGMNAQEVLELLKSPPPIETDIDAYLRTLALTPGILTALLANPVVEESLLCCAIFIFLEQDQADYCRNELRRILGSIDYQHLVTFIAYIKTCHIWIEANPDMDYAADKRIQENLAALLEEPDLADFFSNYPEHVRRERQSQVEQLVQDRNSSTTEVALRQQIERERLVVEIAQRIRKSLNLDEILQTTGSEVRQFLQVDRVFIYRFEPDWGGTVVVESVGSGWQPILGSSLKDPTFAEAYIQPYKQGRIQATADIYAGGLTPCYIDFLAQFQVRATLVVPILQGEELWGLLVANHCLTPRQWQQLEIDLLKQLATQVAIAIQQSELYQLSRSELGDRQRAEQALSVSLKDLADMKFALDQSSIVASTDYKGTINYVNDNFCKISKYSREDLIGQDHRILNSGYHSQEFFREMWATIANGQVWKGEIRNRDRDGTFYWVDTTIVPFLTEVGQPYQYVAISRDITARKRAEVQIQEQTTLLDQSQDAILVLDMEGQICFWNKSANRLFGWTTAEAIGTKIEKLGFKHSPQLQAVQKVVSQVGEWHGELHPVTKSGQEIIVESRWTLVRDSEDKPKSILVVNTDITKKKQLEAQFLRAQRMESIGTLAGGIAHDLNNVLTPIIASAQLLLSNQLNDQKRHRLLTTVETSAKRGAALVKQVLSFSRGVEGRFTILQLRHLLSEIQQIVKETFPKAIEFRMLLPPELWVVSGDATQLHQVFMNLCVNARDAMPYGGNLTITAENLSID